jgi:glycosyltransferase involved in cell wall biosynthesis
MSPLVSILIPCYNAQRWIAQAIESSLAQTWPEKEVIVVDDGSTDGSLDVIRQFDGRVRWETGPNRGGGAARNRLLELARGEWLQYLDADDYLRPRKIEAQVEFIREHPNCDIVCSPTAWERVEHGELVCTDEVIPEPRDAWVLLARWRLPQTGGPLWRRDALKDVGGWRIGQPCCQEHELYFRLLAAKSRFEYCDSCLAVYRDWDHGGRVTRKSIDEVNRQRLLIMDLIESHLAKHNDLTPIRRYAINDLRHMIARDVWHQNLAWATTIMKRIQSSDAEYYPGAMLPSPKLYSLAYRLFGFRGAQLLALARHAVRSRLSFQVVHRR